MYNEEILKKVAACGGFFTMKMLPSFCVSSLTKYINRKNCVEVISTRRRTETGYIYKIPDTLLNIYCNPDARKKRRVLTIKGTAEFFRRTKEYVNKNCKNRMMSDHYNKPWYNEIYEEILNDREYSNRTMYNVTDYKLFVSFTRILANFNQNISVVHKNNEKDFRLEHGLLDKKQISTGITFGYSFSRNKVIILVSDFMKSERSLMQILLYYNSPEFEILIYTLRPAEMLEARLRKKLSVLTGGITSIKVVNDPFLNQFFGEY